MTGHIFATEMFGLLVGLVLSLAGVQAVGCRNCDRPNTAVTTDHALLPARFYEPQMVIFVFCDCISLREKVPFVSCCVSE